MPAGELNTIFFPSAAAFRKWLEENHDQAQELWVGFYKKQSGKKGITPSEALDEVLCFGWIDGIRKSVDEHRYINRYTPRRPKSNWSAININRVNELKKLGLMMPSGLKAFEKRDVEKTSLYNARPQKLPAVYEKKMKTNKKAWDFFQTQSPSYQRLMTWWIMSAKKEETREKRLAVLIEDSKLGRKLGLVASSSKDR